MQNISFLMNNNNALPTTTEVAVEGSTTRASSAAAFSAAGGAAAARPAFEGGAAAVGVVAAPPLTTPPAAAADERILVDRLVEVPPAAARPGAPRRKKKGQQAKSPNFCSEEDVALTKAWMNVSNDAQKGADMTAEIFWERIKQKFDMVLSEEVPEHQFNKLVDRPAMTLRSRFQRQIQKKCLLFNSYYSRCSNSPPSGTNKSDWEKKALNDYKECEGELFTFTSCFEILRTCPKFNFGASDINDDDLDRLSCEDHNAASVNIIGAPMGSSLPRPIGRCRAKRKALEEASRNPVDSPNSLSSVGTMESMHQMMSDMVNQQSSVVTTLNKQTAVLEKLVVQRKKASARKQKVEAQNFLCSSYKNVYEIENRSGNTTAAAATLKKIYEINRAMEAQVSSTLSEDDSGDEVV